jgi:Calcineurin-like phosphoesterase
MARRFRLHLALPVILAVLAAITSTRAGAASPCEFNDIERVVAVGDVHGAYERYLDILRVARIVDADGRWAGGRTHFVQVGDLVDRGDDSRKVLDFLKRLEREAPASGGRVHILLGNHEVARMLGDLRLTTAGEYTAFANADSEELRQRFVRASPTRTDSEREALLKQLPLGALEMRQAFGRDGDYGKWLRELPVVVTIDGFVFVHGGISPAVAPLGCAAINAQVRRELTSDLDKTRAAPLASLAARVDGPLWYRGLAQEPDTFVPQVTEILSQLHARSVVIGHTVVPSGRITTRFAGRVVQIDTGMQPAYVPDGRASALEIRNGETTAIYADRTEHVAVAGDPHP